MPLAATDAVIVVVPTLPFSVTVPELFTVAIVSSLLLYTTVCPEPLPLIVTVRVNEPSAVVLLTVVGVNDIVGVFAHGTPQVNE